MNTIMREDSRSIVERVDNTVVKRFMPGHELDTYVYNTDWINHVNSFSNQYKHFPQVLECNKHTLVTEFVAGKTLRECRFESYSNDMDAQVDFFKTTQLYYYRFIANILEYNQHNNIYMFHSDLNYSNMFIVDERIVCIDMDAVRINYNWAENNWIQLPSAIMQHDADELNYQYNRVEQKKLKYKLSKNKYSHD